MIDEDIFKAFKAKAMRARDEKFWDVNI